MGKYVECDFAEAFEKYEKGLRIKSLESNIEYEKYKDMDYLYLKKSQCLNTSFCLNEIRGKWLVYEK